MPMIGIRFGGIAVVRPIYEDGGVASSVTLTSGRVVTVLRRPQTFVRQILAYDAIGWREYQSCFAAAVHGRQSMPVAHRGVVLMTCKMRHPAVAGDPAYGYVRFDLIERVEEQDGAAILILRDGTLVDTVVKAATILKDQRRASMLLNSWQRGPGSTGDYSDGKGGLLPVRVHRIAAPDEGMGPGSGGTGKPGGAGQ